MATQLPGKPGKADMGARIKEVASWLKVEPERVERADGILVMSLMQKYSDLATLADLIHACDTMHACNCQVCAKMREAFAAGKKH